MVAPQSPPPVSPPPLFKFSDVPAEHRDWLRRRTEDVESLTYRVACDHVRIGVILAEVRGKLRRRQFKAWLLAETPISRPWAYKLIRIAAAFAPHVSPGETQRIEPKALYLLSLPSTPPEARAFAIQEAGDGRRVTAADARAIIAAQTARDPDPDKKAVRAYEKGKAAAGLSDRGPAPPDKTAALARLGAAMWELLHPAADGDDRSRKASWVHVSVIEEDEDDPLYSVTAYTPGGLRTQVRRAVVDALEAVLGRELARQCPTCKEHKPVSLFGEHRGRDRQGGKTRCCKVCERKRLARLKRRRKAEKRRAAVDPKTGTAL